MQNSRFFSAYIFIVIAFLTLFCRYGYLQLVLHPQLSIEAVNNYSSQISTLPIRGNIIDKNGVVLANNTVSYVVAALPKELRPHLKTILERVAKYANLTEFDQKKLMAQLHNAKNYDWVIIKDDLDESEVANLTAHSYAIPEVSVFARTKRFYPFADIYAHSIGYVGRISLKEKTALKKSSTVINYLNSDYIGKSGLENYYESALRGSLGKKIIQTDAHGNETGAIANTPAINGNTIQLTLDSNLQKLAWDLLGDNKGAIVAIDPQTGGILAFVSKPAYNPNWFVDGIDLDDWDDLSQNTDNPLLNRAAQGTFPPGSTFKPFMALTALDLGFRTPTSTYYDNGYFIMPGSKHVFHDSFRGGHGLINFTQAIYYSSDTFFYSLGLAMGIDNANKVLPRFGFGKPTGIDLPKESPGLLPSKAWKARKFANNPYQKKWLLVDNIPFAVGQGFNHYTPLQMAYATAIIANNGVAVTPHFLDKVIDDKGNTTITYIPKTKSVDIPDKYFAFIKQAMQKVITIGTAHQIYPGLKYTMAGKTGTAQVVGLGKNSRQAKFSGKKFKDHAWFIAFAPVDKPKIAIAVLVENGGWGATAAPIARQILDAYLLPKESTTFDLHTVPTTLPVKVNDE
jgi:penicillin-binding protein 2